MKSITSAPRVGTVAIECRLHPYGVYIQKMMQSIEEQWNQLARGSSSISPTGPSARQSDLAVHTRG